MELIPYGKRHGTSHRDEEQMVYLAQHGFAAIRVDCRGTGESQGVLDDEYLNLEHKDALDCIEWISKQKWCTGRVGMMGMVRSFQLIISQKILLLIYSLSLY